LPSSRFRVFRHIRGLERGDGAIGSSGVSMYAPPESVVYLYGAGRVLLCVCVRVRLSVRHKIVESFLFVCLPQYLHFGKGFVGCCSRCGCGRSCCAYRTHVLTLEVADRRSHCPRACTSTSRVSPSALSHSVVPLVTKICALIARRTSWLTGLCIDLDLLLCFWFVSSQRAIFLFGVCTLGGAAALRKG
jgi:hypothetical protein